MKKIIDMYNKAEEVFIVAGIAAMAIILFLQVVLRFIFSDPWVWAEEVSKIIFIWVSWLGISMGQRHGEHIKVTMVTDRLKGNTQKIVLVLANIFSLVIVVFFLYYGIIVTSNIMTIGSVTAALKIPRWLIYLSVPVSCFAMSVRLIAETFYIIKGRGEE